MKKIFSLMLSLSLISILSFSVSANENEYSFNIDEIIDSLTTIDYNELPEGITPLEFDSEEEFLDFYLSSLDNINIVIEENSGNFFTPNASPISTYAYVGNYPGSYSTRKDLIKIGISITYLNLTTNYTYATENTYGPIQVPRNIFTGASCGISLSGLTLGMELSNVSSVSTYQSNSCTSVATGTVDYYILIDGLIKYMSQDFTMSHSFQI